MLLREKKISRELVDKLLSWENSGFDIHNQVKIQSHDSHGGHYMFGPRVTRPLLSGKPGLQNM